jgi:hypothetical protein
LRAAARFPRARTKGDREVRRTQPAAYLKILALLVPREHKVEHRNPLKELTDQELEAMIEYLKASIEAEAQSAKVINGEVLDPVALLAPKTSGQPAPGFVEDDKPKRPNKVMDAADTAIGPRERNLRGRA